MPGNDIISDLKRDYRTKRALIERRLSDFQAVFERGDEAIFEELCFCILTAGSSAHMGLRTVSALRDILLTGSEAELQERARKHRVRFWRLRPSYIYCSREHLKSMYELKLGALLKSFSDPLERREFFAANRSIKGLGYKEASHFLRNIGYRGYAILDKHIVNSLREMGVISRRLKPTTRKGYLVIEARFKEWADRIGIDFDHLDLLLWSRKTGEILK